MSNCSLREAHDLATSSQQLFRDELAQDIVTMCDVVWRASLRPAAVASIDRVLREDTKAKAARTDSSLSDHSVNCAHPRPHEDPSMNDGLPNELSFVPL